MNDVPALIVRQWLGEWDRVTFAEKARRRKPEPHFYVFSLSASRLLALCGIERRTTERGLKRSKDLGIQRRHDEGRSKEIREFIQYGYPWSELNEARRASGEYDDLRKPGWLPTAIVVNILAPGDKRRGDSVAPKDLVKVETDGGTMAVVRLPSQSATAGWQPGALHPLEVIDGQHRLWAFEEDSGAESFELPVVAFHGLDISWQAYLFWTINIKPKRINASLAFDLYPLLRTEDWLERFTGHSIYRETRSQELVEALWSHTESPWYHRINMLGEPGLRRTMVSQAAWIRSLMASYVKAWESAGGKIGGLFGARVGADEEVLPWSRAEQAAFLIHAGSQMRDAVKDSRESWAVGLRKAAKDAARGELEDSGDDAAFYGPYTLLNTDQGIRVILQVSNDLCYARAEDLSLPDWGTSEDASASDDESVSKALGSLKKHAVSRFLGEIAGGLARYDWRTSAAPGLDAKDQTLKAAFRGSGGYKELRKQVLTHLARMAGRVGQTAKDVSAQLGYK